MKIVFTLDNLGFDDYNNIDDHFRIYYGLEIKDNSKSSLSINKEGISYVTMNLMERLILTHDECLQHA